jgi:hypothetical protein
LPAAAERVLLHSVVRENTFYSKGEHIL